jgi:cytoskeleton protein RodZ
MSLFQRIKKPFGEVTDEAAPHLQAGVEPAGELLRERREELGLDLAEVGDALRIKPVFLVAIEQSQAEALPGPAYAIGFIRAYAHYLGLDSERVIERYKHETGEIRSRPDLSLPMPLAARSLPGGAILLVGLILALCGYGTWYYLVTGERSRPERVAAVPAELQRAMADTLLPAGAAPAAAKPAAVSSASGTAPRFGSGLFAAPESGPVLPAPAADAPASTVAAAAAVQPPAAAMPAAGPPAAPTPATPDAPAAGGVAAPPAGDPAGKPGSGIEIRALADCWIQVRTADDQTIVFSRVLKAGEIYRVPRAGLLLRTGNAGALAIAVDGKPAPSIGGVGVLRRSVALDAEALIAGTAVHG